MKTSNPHTSRMHGKEDLAMRTRCPAQSPRRWAALAFGAIAALTAAASPATAAETDAEGPDRTHWGWEVGGVFSEFPVSKAIDSGFAILMSHGYYSWDLGTPGGFVQPSLSVGAYGFQLLLPVPEMSLGATLGAPGQDLRGKVSVGGFYDMFVGGHAGLTLSGGLLIKDRFNINLFMVPFGKDADRDYLYMAGIRDEELPCSKADPCVEMPYFGIFVGMQY